MKMKPSLLTTICMPNYNSIHYAFGDSYDPLLNLIRLFELFVHFAVGLRNEMYAITDAIEDPKTLSILCSACAYLDPSVALPEKCRKGGGTSTLLPYLLYTRHPRNFVFGVKMGP